jgi:hypothetical protein
MLKDFTTDNFDKSNAFGGKKPIEVLDVLSDMAKTLSQSVYSENIVFRGAFTLVAAMFDYGVAGFPRFTRDLDLDCATDDWWDELFNVISELLTMNSRNKWHYELEDIKRVSAGAIVKLSCMTRKGLLGMTYNSVVSNGYVNGVVCCETASGLLGMSTAGERNFQFLFESDTMPPIRSRYFSYFPVADLASVPTQKSCGFTVTTPLQTIMDMIRFECYNEFVCDSIRWWKDKYDNLDVIESKLKELGLFERYEEDYAPYL